VTTKEAIFTWARRMAADGGLEPHHFIIQSDGFVYAMPEKHGGDALSWWPLPYLGPDGEEELAAGRLCEDTANSRPT
jgi:hypothetical protein